MKRSKFNLGYTHLLTCNMGELIPVGLTEVLPGDSFRQNTTALVRCAPMLAPPMHPVDVRIHHWYVPHRLVWNSWESFITGGQDGLNNSAFPTVQLTNPSVGSLADHLGCVPEAIQTVSALPFRGYNLIFNEWYRDEDLVTARPLSKADGVDSTTDLTKAIIAWEKDYYTSARPWEQKGPQVTIPLTGNAPISGLGVSGNGSGPNANRSVRESDGQTRTYPASQQAANTDPTLNFRMSGTFPDIYADLSSVAGVTVNQLRQSLAIQRYEEAAARYGSRYTEYLARLGVRSSDARLQRPEYLGGGRQRLSFSEVLQTAPPVDQDGDPVATLKGHGITAVRSNRYTRFFEEHGYVFTLLSVRPKTIYTSGIPRTFNRRTKYDFWQKELQHIGQQPILNKEVYAKHSNPDGTFGYQDRFDEYRRQESQVSGEFLTLQDYWHFARIFASEPALNSSFVTCVPPERPFAVTSEDVLQIHVKHSIAARRLISQTGSSFTF